MDLRQTSEYADYMMDLGWYVWNIDGLKVYIRKVLPFFYVAKIQRFYDRFSISALRKVLEYRGVYIVYLEPNKIKDFEYFRELGFNKEKSPLVPSKTIIIDLAKSEKALLTEMHYKTRYNIRKKRILNIEYRISDEIEKFAEFWQKDARGRGMFLPMKREIVEIYNAFGKEARILVAEKAAGPEGLWPGGNWLGAILTISTKDTIYYMYAASNPEGKKLFAPTLLVWEVIKLGKRLGKKYFDFEGIYDERFPLKSWKGFTRFKQSFGGREIVYPGTLKKLFLNI